MTTDFENIPACEHCGAMAGTCSDYPKCPGGHANPRGPAEMTTAAMRAKMRVESVEYFEGSERLKFRAVGASRYPNDGTDEDNTYARFTPSAELTLTVTNPALRGKFEPGQTYYVDFTAVPAAPTVPQQVQA